MTINQNPPETKAAGWYDLQANPIVLHGPFAQGQEEAKNDASASGATEPICFRWEDRITLEQSLGI